MISKEALIAHRMIETKRRQAFENSDIPALRELLKT